MDNLDSTKQKSITLAQKINVLRAAVMGANDGIISVAGIVLGVAGAASSSFAILISGLAGMLAGTISMAMGEYVSVHSQSDAEVAAVVREKKILDTDYQKEFLFIKNKLLKAGISEELSHKATKEMMDRDPLKSIVREKYGFELNEKTNPSNGICLNALHDKAFDKGYITIDTNYVIHISKCIKDIFDGKTVDLFFNKYNNTKILLPEKFLPESSFLEYHNNFVFEKWK